MKKILLLAVFCSSFILTAKAQAQDQVEITVYDKVKKANALVSGKLQSENAGGITYKPTVGDAKTVPASDVVDVAYELAGEAKALQARARTQENQIEKAPDKAKVLKDAITLYEEMRTKLEGSKPAQRNVEYKLARLKSRLAQEDASQRDPAIAALAKFKTDNPDCWQVTHVMKLLAQLLMDKKSFDEAQKAYDDLAKLPVSPEVKQECELLSAQAMTRGGKYAEAQTRLQAALKDLKPDDPQHTKVQIFLSACKVGTGGAAGLDDAVKDLEGVIGKVQDSDLKALAYNTLGDCYIAGNKLNDAKWQYLWVDIVYNQNRSETAKAVAQLAEIFDKLKDEEKAKQYKDKLQTFK